MATARFCLDELDVPVQTAYSWEIDPAAQHIIQTHYPDTIQLGDIHQTNWPQFLQELSQVAQGTNVLVCAGPPCPDFSRVRGKNAPGKEGPVGKLFVTFSSILEQITQQFPDVLVMVENVIFQQPEEVQFFETKLRATAIVCDSADLQVVRRPRLWWTRIDWEKVPEQTWHTHANLPQLKLPPSWRQCPHYIFNPEGEPHHRLVDGRTILPTMLTPAKTMQGRSMPSTSRPSKPALQRWTEDNAQYSPWFYEDENMSWNGETGTTLLIEQKERAHGFPPGWTDGADMHSRHCMLGNSWHTWVAIFILSIMLNIPVASGFHISMNALWRPHRNPHCLGHSRLDQMRSLWLNFEHDEVRPSKALPEAGLVKSIIVEEHLQKALANPDPRAMKQRPFHPIRFAIQILEWAGADIALWRNEVLDEIEALIDDFADITTDWWNSRPLHVQKAYAKTTIGQGDTISSCSQIPLLQHLLSFFQHPDLATLSDEFDNGFFLMGNLPPGYGWRPRTDNKYQNPISPAEFKRANQQYQHTKVCRPRLDFSDVMLSEVMSEVKMGRMEGPFEAPTHWPRQAVAVQANPMTAHLQTRPCDEVAAALAFPIHQVGSDDKDKVRRGEDWRRSCHNSTVSVADAPHHDTVDEFVALARHLFDAGHSDLQIWGHDHEGAYRQLPLRNPNEAFLILNTPAGPTLWRHNVLLFGAVGSVWAYNRVGDVITWLSAVLFGIPALHYVDDYGSVEPRHAAPSGFRAFSLFNSRMGFTMKPSKEQPPAQAHKVQGVIIHLDPDQIVVKPTDNRLQKMMRALHQFIAVDSMTCDEAAQLAGKLQFLCCSFFGKVGRTHLKAIYGRQYAKRHMPCLGRRLRHALIALTRMLPALRPREIPFIDEYHPPILFGDAFCEVSKSGHRPEDPNGWGLLIFPRKSSMPEAIGARGSVPFFVIQHFCKSKAFIFFLETITQLIGCFLIQPILHSRYICFVDNEPAKYALLKGYTKDPRLNSLLSDFWQVQAANAWDPWFERVSSKANVADAISRNDVSMLEARGWPEREVNLEPFWRELCSPSRTAHSLQASMKDAVAQFWT